MTSPERAAEISAAQAALYGYNPADLPPGGLPPRWGCSITAHLKLGWCGCCRGVTVHVEAMGWRLWASGQPQDVD